MIKISIIVPIYNAKKYLSRCLESLINQTLKEIEILTINDGSKDNSDKIIKEYMKKDSKIRIYNKENGGLSDARNYGLKMAKGKYILFVDADDCIEKNTCKELYEIAEKEQLEILKFNYFDEKNKKYAFKYKEQYMRKTYNGIEYLKRVFDSKDEMTIVAWNALYNRKYLQDNKFKFKKNILHEDELWTPQIIIKANRIMQVDNVYYNYKYNKNSITTQKDKTKNAMDIINTCKELDNIYSKINDRKLRKQLKNTIVTKYLEAFVMGKMYEKEKKKYIDKKFLINKSYTIRNKAKVFLFFINSKLYYKINIIKNGED